MDIAVSPAIPSQEIPEATSQCLMCNVTYAVKDGNEALCPGCDARVEHVADEMVVLDPGPDEEIFTVLFEQQDACFWTPKELKFNLDAPDLKKLNPREARLFKTVLQFFASADGEVLENVVRNFGNEAETESIRCAYVSQAHFEAIHAVTYDLALRNYIPNDKERRAFNMAFRTNPLIKKRDEWMTRYLSIPPISPKATDDASILKKVRRILAFTCAESIFFMSAFMIIQWLRSREMFPEFASSNEAIARDEWFHVHMGIARIIYNLKNRRHQIGFTDEMIIRIVREAVDLEVEFATALIPSVNSPDRFEGLRLEEKIDNTYTIANMILEKLGVAPQWTPLCKEIPPWVAWVEAQMKNNFYERKVLSYTQPKAVSANPKDDVDF